MKTLFLNRIITIIFIFLVNVSFGQTYTVTRASTDDIIKGSTNQVVLKLEITGSTGTLTKITIKDHDDDVSYTNLTIWSTGNSNTFTTETKFGETIASPLGNDEPNKFFGSSTLLSGSNYFWVAVDVPSGATTGEIINFDITWVYVDGAGSNPNGPDGNRKIVDPPSMSFQSISVTQASTADVVVGTTDNEVLKIKIVTTGTNNPLYVTKIRLNLNGSDDLADIYATKAYYTGATNTFSNNSLYGTMPTPSSVTDYKNITGTQYLSEGDNYFWISMDVASAATVNNVIDARILKVFISDGVDTTDVLNATEQNPSGNRKIVSTLPPPDNPCDAWTITVGCSGKKLIMDNTGMSNSGISTPSCGVYSDGDVWCKLVVPSSGKVQVETYPLDLTDVAMAIYESSSNCNGTLTELACDDNSGFGNMAKIVLNGLSAEDTLYVRVWDNNNDQVGKFEIDAVDVDKNYCVTGNSIDLGGGCAQLTDNAQNQSGSVWDANDKLDFTNDWTYDFKINLGSNNNGADGICFVIQNDPRALRAEGEDGVYMGAGGIENSLIVEIDTYLNNSGEDYVDYDDGISGVDCSTSSSEYDHLDIWLNGNINPVGDGRCPSSSPGSRIISNAVGLTDINGNDYNIENGNDHTLRVSYNSTTGEFTAEVLNDAATESYGSVSYTITDVMNLFHTKCPYFGLTGSTGGLSNKQTACLAEEFSPPLPVKLVNFEAECNNGYTLLKWVTASEIDNDYFVIEKSQNAKSFKEIAIIDGSGNSNQLKEYTYLDDCFTTENTYYRLKQVNYDGTSEYYKTITSNCGKNINLNKVDVSVWPNPFNQQLYVQLEVNSNHTYKVEIEDCLGKLIVSCQISSATKINKINIEKIKNKGLYFIFIYDNDSNETLYMQKIIKI